MRASILNDACAGGALHISSDGTTVTLDFSRFTADERSHESGGGITGLTRKGARELIRALISLDGNRDDSTTRTDELASQIQTASVMLRLLNSLSSQT